MKKLMIDIVGDLRCGMKLVCPENMPAKTFEITPKTKFSVNPTGGWGVDCKICGKMHLLNHVYQVA